MLHLRLEMSRDPVENARVSGAALHACLQKLRSPQGARPITLQFRVLGFGLMVDGDLGIVIFYRERE
jgi:hypothetical protein